MKKYIEQDLECPEYMFHGSKELLEFIEPRQSHDSLGNSINIDDAIFLSSSLFVSSAYAFKDSIKNESIKDGKKYSFNITDKKDTFPIMHMSNVSIPENIEGYIYVFLNNEEFINEPKGSLQYKCYSKLCPIEVIKINYKDFEELYHKEEEYIR